MLGWQCSLSPVTTGSYLPDGLDTCGPSLASGCLQVAMWVCFKYLMSRGSMEFLSTYFSPWNSLKIKKLIWVPLHLLLFGAYYPYTTEDGESLEDAVLRELSEETGLEVTEEERKSSHILGLWESVYPPVLAMGEPKRHHVVVYLHITLSRASGHLNKEFKVSMRPECRGFAVVF